MFGSGHFQPAQRTAEEGDHRGNRSRLLTMACSRRMRKNRHKLKEVNFRLDVKNTCFTIRTVEQWRCAVSVLGSFQDTARLQALSYLVWPQSSCSLEQEDELETSWDNFLPEFSHSLMILCLRLKILNYWSNWHESALESWRLEYKSPALW